MIGDRFEEVVESVSRGEGAMTILQDGEPVAVIEDPEMLAAMRAQLEHGGIERLRCASCEAEFRLDSDGGWLPPDTDDCAHPVPEGLVGGQWVRGVRQR